MCGIGNYKQGVDVTCCALLKFTFYTVRCKISAPKCGDVFVQPPSICCHGVLYTF